MQFLKRFSQLALILGMAFAGVNDAQAEKAQTKVFLNGIPTPVYFNDGDSFKILEGRYKGARARLAGFNTLESYGAVHSWGDWTRKELYHLAKMGTLNAQKGVWHCTSNGDKDGYGRMLWDCPDLIEDQVRKGLAHTLMIGEEGALERYTAAQLEAMDAKRGIWSHGVPTFVLTSTHSAAEEQDDKKKPTYNRLVSTQDGHSRKWIHNDEYAECFDVCYMPPTIDAAKLTEVAAALKADARFADTLAEVSDADFEAMIIDFIDRTGTLPKDKISGEENKLLSIELNARAQAGELGELQNENKTCMLYVDYRRRFGRNAAKCLK